MDEAKKKMGDAMEGSEMNECEKRSSARPRISKPAHVNTAERGVICCELVALRHFALLPKRAKQRKRAKPTWVLFFLQILSLAKDARGASSARVQRQLQLQLLLLLLLLFSFRWQCDIE